MCCEAFVWNGPRNSVTCLLVTISLNHGRKMRPIPFAFHFLKSLFFYLALTSLLCYSSHPSSVRSQYVLYNLFMDVALL